MVQMWFSCVWLSVSGRGSIMCDMVQRWFSCAWHGSDVVQVCVMQCCRLWLSCGSVVCGMVQAWPSVGSVAVQLYVWHGSVVCGSAVQALVHLCEIWLRGGSVVHGMVQMWFR